VKISIIHNLQKLLKITVAVISN